MTSRVAHLAAVPSPATGGADVDGPGAVGGGGQQVRAAALEVEVLPVEGAVVRSTPGHACGRALRRPGATQQTAAHQRGGLGVCGGRELLRGSDQLQHRGQLRALTREESVGAGRAGLVGGVPPAQAPQAAAALLHGHEGRVMDPREVLTSPGREAAATHPHTWRKEDTDPVGSLSLDI